VAGETPTLPDYRLLITANPLILISEFSIPPFRAKGGHAAARGARTAGERCSFSISSFPLHYFHRLMPISVDHGGVLTLRPDSTGRHGCGRWLL